jgi:hypothetical protein
MGRGAMTPAQLDVTAVAIIVCVEPRSPKESEMRYGADRGRCRSVSRSRGEVDGDGVEGN